MEHPKPWHVHFSSKSTTAMANINDAENMLVGSLHQAEKEVVEEMVHAINAHDNHDELVKACRNLLVDLENDSDGLHSRIGRQERANMLRAALEGA